MGRVKVATTVMVVLVVATVCCGQEGRDCTDANGRAGRCTTISNCQPLRQILQEIRSNTASPDALSILRRSVCSIENNVPLMCCATPSSSTRNPQPPRSTGTDLLPSSCGVTGLTDKIIDGEDAPLLAWPWMALLNGRESGTTGSFFYCGGVLINDRYVLTAAHCFKPDRSPNLEFVRLGEYDTAKNPDCERGLCAPTPQDIRVQKEDIIIHPEYDVNCRDCNDIALLRLSRPVTLIPLHVVPICLPIDPVRDMGFSVEEFQGKQAWAAGWGSTSRNPFRPDSPNILQQVLLPIHEGPTCSSLRRGYPVTESTLCAGGEGKDTCKGDSGGPLVLSNNGETKRYVVGITSLGPSVCGLTNTQALYTSVHHYVPWILENLRP